MPHIIVEYSKNLADDTKISQLCQAIFDQFAAHATFPDPTAIKVRAIAFEQNFQTLANDHFVHATIKLLPGRDAATKSQLTNDLLAMLKEKCTTASSHSVDIEDLSSAYVKASR